MKVCKVCRNEKQTDSKHHPSGACSQRCADRQLQREAIANMGGANGKSKILHRGVQGVRLPDEQPRPHHSYHSVFDRRW